MQDWQRQPRYKVRQKGASAPYQEIRVINPSRGLNLLIADILSNDKEATSGSKNIEYVEGGAVRKRMGYDDTLTAGLSNAPKGLGSYISESSNYLITSDGGVLKGYQAGTWSALAGAVTLNANADIALTSLFLSWLGNVVTGKHFVTGNRFPVSIAGACIVTGKQVSQSRYGVSQSR